MEKEYNQLELFSQGKDNQVKPRSSRPFFSYITKYEKTLLIIIGFLITAIASFSLGVKKGKSYIMLKTGSQLDIATVIKPQPQLPILPTEPKQPIKDELFQPLKKVESRDYIQNYTIQVASFTNRVNAQKEADILKRKGLSSQVLSKGRFSIVCVGNFSKREEAELLLSKLRKQYQDCRIRRL